MRTSKIVFGLIVIIIAALVVLAAYFLGAQRALAPKTPLAATTTSSVATSSQSLSGSVSVTPPPATVLSTEPVEYRTVSGWQVVMENQAGFTIMHPQDFTVDQDQTTPTTDWRLDSQDPGIEVLTITVPGSFEAKTNFVGATLTVGYSQNTQAIANCTVAPQEDNVTSTTASINGIKFVVYHSTGVGAGQLYETTSYRTIHAGACYAVEYTIHSSELANFPTSYGYTQFNDPEITDVMNRVVGTFSFL